MQFYSYVCAWVFHGICKCERQYQPGSLSEETHLNFWMAVTCIRLRLVTDAPYWMHTACTHYTCTLYATYFCCCCVYFIFRPLVVVVFSICFFIFLLKFVVFFFFVFWLILCRCFWNSLLTISLHIYADFNTRNFQCAKISLKVYTQMEKWLLLVMVVVAATVMVMVGVCIVEYCRNCS